MRFRVEDVVELAPAVEIREHLVGVDDADEPRDVGALVEIEFWRDASGETDGSWAIDVRGPEPDRVRRFLLHTSVDLLKLDQLVDRRTGEPA